MKLDKKPSNDPDGLDGLDFDPDEFDKILEEKEKEERKLNA